MALLWPPPLRVAQGRIEVGCSCFLAVLPAKAGIHFDLAVAVVLSPAPAPGLARARARALAKAFRALRELLFFERQRKVTKRKQLYAAPNDEAVGYASRPGISVRRLLRLRKRRTSMCAAPAGFVPTGLPRLTRVVSKAEAEAEAEAGSVGAGDCSLLFL